MPIIGSGMKTYIAGVRIMVGMTTTMITAAITTGSYCMRSGLSRSADLNLIGVAAASATTKQRDRTKFRADSNKAKNMRGKAFVAWESVFLGVGLLALTPSGNPTTVGGPSNSPSVQFPAYVMPPIIPSATKTVGPLSPLRVWECAASWYGEDFDGQLTATGEIYDMYAATAAHPALPLGSIVRVVNTQNHRTQVVRINDRGPYAQGRELDVSYEVARKLGFDQTGVARVRVELLEVPSGSASVHRD
jgi:hypothetical protein